MADTDKKGCLLGWLFGGASAADEKLPSQSESAGADAANEAVAQEAVPPSVMVSKKFITAAEFSFFRVLQLAMKDDAYVLAQVSLGQLIYVKNGKGQQTWRNRIQSKAVDFLICDAQQMKPLLVVELDDASHDAADRQKRDQVLDEVLHAAGLPVLHVRTSMNYDPRELRRLIDEKLRRS